MKLVVGVLLTGLGVWCLPLALADMPPTEDERRIEEEKREALEQTEITLLEGEDKFRILYGGWFDSLFINSHNNDNDPGQPDLVDKTTYADLRLWLKLGYRSEIKPDAVLTEKEHLLYLRLKNLYRAQTSDIIKNDRDNEADLDLGYLDFDLTPFHFRLGRHWFMAGRGIAYSMINDGLQFRGDFKKYDLAVWASQTRSDEPNIDYSMPGYNKGSKRRFFGLEGGYLLSEKTRLYTYLLIQRDKTREKPEVTNDYTYDSEYLGLGFKSTIGLNVDYWGEIVRQTGESIIFSSNHSEKISAWAIDVGIKYTWISDSQPSVSLEYALGSGDSDRINVTNTLYGNQRGSDRNFLYFGYFPGGYALAPRLSNLHIIKLNGVLKPLVGYWDFRNLKAELSLYLYYKDEKTGGISDADATEKERSVGNEIDLSIYWPVFSDLAASLRWGRFTPGDAYPGTWNKAEDYFSLGMTLVF